MKLVTIVLGLFALGTSGFLIKVPTGTLDPIKTTNKLGWTNRQKLILTLFDYVYEPSKNPTVIQLANEANDEFLAQYMKDPEAIKGLIIQNDVKNLQYTEFNSENLIAFKTLSEALYDAPTFDVFFKLAAWARQNVKFSFFLDSFYAAILRRRDCQKLLIPAPYEVVPNYFVTVESYAAAVEATQSNSPLVEGKGVVNDGNTYVVVANYTADWHDNMDDSMLAYFNEDIGLNSFTYFTRLLKTPWILQTERMNSQFGLYAYHTIKQLVARYDMERLSNGLEELETLSWDKFICSFYDPMIMNEYENEFGQRGKCIDINHKNIQLLRNIEDSLSLMVNDMLQKGVSKTIILNRLYEKLVLSEDSYEKLAYQVINSANEDFGSISVLNHYITMARDPLFWRVKKTIFDLMDKALCSVPAYTRPELYFPGLEVTDIIVKKMSTNFEFFDFEVTDALPYLKKSIRLKFSQPRLTHKPFTIKLNVTSVVPQRGFVKIYIGPKALPGNIAANKNKFMQLDAFDYSFKPGSNVVTRKSEELNFADDFPAYRTLLKQIEDAELGLDTLPLKSNEKLAGFPSRLAIPKGTVSGLPLQIFVFIAPYKKITKTDLGIKEELNSAVLTPGYPLDLMMTDETLFNLPNSFMKEIIVTHKDFKFTTGQETEKKSSDYKYDYASKKGKYGSAKSYDNKEVNDKVIEEELKVLANEDNYYKPVYANQFNEIPSMKVLPLIRETTTEDINDFNRDTDFEDSDSVYEDRIYA